MYVENFDDYVQAFKQTTLYYYFKKGGPSCQGLDRSEFFLHKVTQSSDLKQLVNIILKNALGSSFKTKIAHMGGGRNLWFLQIETKLASMIKRGFT